MSLLFFWDKNPFSANLPQDLVSANWQQLLGVFCKEIHQRGVDKLCSGIHECIVPDLVATDTAGMLAQVQKIYQVIVSSLGESTANNLCEAELDILEKRTEKSKDYYELLKILPLPIKQNEKLAMMSRQELETQLHQKVQELESVKQNLEYNVAQKTKEISAERNKLAVMITAISDGVIGLDLDRKVVMINPAATNLIGVPDSQIIGRHLNELIKVFENTVEIPPEVYAPNKTNYYEGVVYAKEMLRITNAVGKEKFVRFSSSQIAEGLEVNLGCILTIHDTSGEEQLEQMKLDFVSMAAHELRTPLTALNSYLYIFIKENKDILNPEQNKFLNRMNISTQQLMSLVENLLSVSRIERGVLKVYLEPLDWVNYVKQSVDEMRPRAAEKGLTLNFLPPAYPIPKVMADKARINEVILNLLANALAYTPPKGTIKVSIEQKESDVITYVSDTGQGIPPESIPHLFTKFYRVSGKLEQGSKGTGLGLYISKAMVEAHRGRIWVNSEVGVGSTFAFSLPIQQ